MGVISKLKPFNDVLSGVKNTLSKVPEYFNPTSNNGNNFWGNSPIAQGLGNVQKTFNPMVGAIGQGLQQIPHPQAPQVPQFKSPVLNTAMNIISTPSKMTNWGVDFLTSIPRNYGETLSRVSTPEGIKTDIASIKKIAKSPLKLSNLNEPGFQDATNLAGIGGDLRGAANLGLMAIGGTVVAKKLAGKAAEKVLLNTRNIDKTLNMVADFDSLRPAAQMEAISKVEQDLKEFLPEISKSKEMLKLKTKDVREWMRQSARFLGDAQQRARVAVIPDVGLGIRNLEGKNVLAKDVQNGMSVGKERGFVTSVKGAEPLTDPTKAGVSGSYIPKPNTKLMGEAQALLNEGASIKFNQVEGLDKKVAATIQEAINLDKTGNHDAAANLFNNLSEHGTELGRGVQAFSMLDKMSPEAIALSAAGKIKKFNATHTTKIPELTGEQQAMISSAVGKIDKLTGRNKNMAIHELQTMINEFIPSSVADKAIAVWKAGLLTSLRTHERNLLGNTIMAGFENVKDIPASLTDRMMSAFTGKRTLTYTNKGVGSGTMKGMQAAKDIVSKGFDPEDAISKFDTHQITWGKNPVEQALKKYTEVVFRTLGAEDKPFWNATFARSLYDQAGSEAINAGRQGDKLFIEKLVKNPNEKMLKTATNEANYATFHDKNFLSNIATAIKRAAQSEQRGPVGSELGKLATEITLPFTGVPSSIALKTMDYSPLGLINGAYNAGRTILSKTPIPELQRQAAQEIGRGVMGTGLFALGAYLMSKGLMTGQPKDAKEAAQWQLENKPSNSVKMPDGRWYSINSIGPQNLVMLAGAKYQEELSPNGGGAGAFLGQMGRDQLNQTFLQGMMGPLNAIIDPTRYGKSFVGNTVNSAVPNIVKDVAKAGDPYARETNSVSDYLKSSIPGVRNTLLPKRDTLGNIVPQEPTGAAAFVDLFNSKTPISNPIVNELSRLNSVGLNSTPSKLDKTQTINGVKQTLTPELLNNLEAQVGPQLTQQLQGLISSSGYQKLSDEDKKNAIQSVVDSVRKKVRGTADLGQGTVTSQSPSTGMGQYTLVNPDTGSVKSIDLSSPIEKPTLTGVDSIDKRLISTYKSDINTRIKDVIALYQDGQISLDQAKKIVGQLQGEYDSTKSKKVSVPKLTINKAKVIKSKKIKLGANLSKFSLTGLKSKTKSDTIKIEQYK